MTARARHRLLFVGGLLAAAALPVAGALLRPVEKDRCRLDGLRVDPRYRVRLVTADGEEEVLCCAGCLRLRLARLSAPPREVWVTDEATGRELPAAEAWYVESLVVTDPATGNRIHVFATEADAARHAASFHGKVLPGPGLDALGTRGGRHR